MSMYQRPLRSDELTHTGVKGMRWGRRRYQNPDGTLTPEGRRHYGIGERYINGFDKKAKRSDTKYDDRINRAKSDKKISGKLFGKDSKYTDLFDKKIDKLEADKKYHHDRTMSDKKNAKKIVKAVDTGKEKLKDSYLKGFDKKANKSDSVYNNRIDRAKSDKKMAAILFGDNSKYVSLFDKKISELEANRKYHHDRTTNDKERAEKVLRRKKSK